MPVHLSYNPAFLSYRTALMSTYPELNLYINGEWRQCASDLPVLNPATEQEIGRLPHASISDLDDALAAAEKGFETWRHVAPIERAKVLMKAAALMRERQEEIALAITAEHGKPLPQARLEVIRGCEFFEWDAGEATRTYGRVIPSAPGVRYFVHHQPIGVVAAFSPRNFPMSQPCRKVAGAIAAGCSIILKAAEETPAGALHIARALHDAGLPPGVLNLVFGTPAETPTAAQRTLDFTLAHAAAIDFLNLAIFNLPAYSVEARALETLPFYDGDLPEGLFHPRRIRDGVHEGVIDGGNQSGIPYGRGWELFDRRYLGKPLVFCGTVGSLPVEVAGRPGEKKAGHYFDQVFLNKRTGHFMRLHACRCQLEAGLAPDAANYFVDRARAREARWVKLAPGVDVDAQVSARPKPTRRDELLRLLAAEGEESIATARASRPQVAKASATASVTSRNTAIADIVFVRPETFDPKDTTAIARAIARSHGGEIDAAEFLGSWSDTALGFWQAAPYYYWPGFHEPNGTSEGLVNADAWSALPDDLKAVIDAIEGALFSGSPAPPGATVDADAAKEAATTCGTA
mgnify:CR=1 FL=1